MKFFSIAVMVCPPVVFDEHNLVGNRYPLFRIML